MKIDPSGSAHLERILLLTIDSLIVYTHLVTPENLSDKLPLVYGQWTDFAGVRDRIKRIIGTENKPVAYRYQGQRANRIERFMGAIKRTDNPVFFYLHTLLPHGVYEYLPSGRYYGPVSRLPHGMREGGWSRDWWEAAQGYQRHLLQVAFVDTLLGQIIDKLKAQDLFERALIIVTSDQGESFKENTAPRAVKKSNYQDILPIPLFIKLPKQNEGVVSDRNVESIDILPTIIDVLEVEVDLDLDGCSGFSEARGERQDKRVISNDRREYVFESHITGKYRTVERMISLFGEGDRYQLYTIGPNSDLLGKPVIEFKDIRRADMEIKLNNEYLFRNVDINGKFLPAHIEGAIQGDFTELPAELAIAINGNIRAVSRTYGNEQRSRDFSAMINEEFFQNGANKIEIFMVQNEGDETILYRTDRVKRLRPYDLGQVIKFGKLGDAARYAIKGISVPGEDFNWSNADSVTFALDIRKPAKDVSLTVQLYPFLVEEKLPSQVVHVSVNGVRVGSWKLLETKTVKKRVVISRALIESNDTTVITFGLPNATRPKDIGYSADARELGVAFSEMTIH